MALLDFCTKVCKRERESECVCMWNRYINIKVRVENRENREVLSRSKGKAKRWHYFFLGLILGAKVRRGLETF